MPFELFHFRSKHHSEIQHRKIKALWHYGIITKVTEPTEWVSSMVAAKKKNTDELRICIDPRDLNKALMRPHHPLKTVEEVASTIPNETVFSILDAKSAFWHIPLDNKSSYYTTFSTVLGHYKYLRMPYGITSGSEVYQQAIEQLLEGLSCKVIVDDILVYGANIHDHDQNLMQVIDRIRQIIFSLNAQKCKFRLYEVKYVGNAFTSQGLLPDDEKVNAITKFPIPSDKKALQRLLGMANYLSRYIPNYAGIAPPLYELLHNDVIFCWESNHITHPAVLAYYDVKQPVLIPCDASKSGFGAALIQNDQPIAYASRTLRENEVKWAQIEKKWEQLCSHLMS